MFNEVIIQLNNSKLNFSEKIKDNFGNAIVRDTYEPFQKSLNNLNCEWSEAEIKKMEIIKYLIELRTIL